MAIIRIARPVGMTAAQYDAVADELHLATAHPLGLIAHAAGEVDGAWQIVQVWESEEYAKRYTEEQLLPALRATLGPDAKAPRTTIYELRELVTP
jgi:hypothetical protein